MSQGKRKENACSEGAPTRSSVGGTPPSGGAEKSKGVSSRSFALLLPKVDPFSVCRQWAGQQGKGRHLHLISLKLTTRWR